MTDVESSDWNATDASNTNATPNGAPANFARTDTKNIFRMIMGAVKRLWNRLTPTVTSAGTAPAFTLTYTGAPAAYVQGMTFAFKTHDTTTGSMTLNVNSVGAKKVFDITGTTQLAAGAFDVGTRMVCSYDTALDSAAGGFIWLNGPLTSRQLPRSYLAGLTLSNNGSDVTNDIDIAAGAARDGGNTADMVLASSITKQLDANWAVGTNAGGLDTGSIANTTYAVWLIKRPDTGVVDVLYSTSFSAPTMPTNYTLKRYIGAIIRSGGSVVKFLQDGDVFWKETPTRDVNSTNPGTSAVTQTLAVPVGRAVRAMIVAGGVNSSNNWYGLLSALASADIAPTSSIYNFACLHGAFTQLGPLTNVTVLTSTSATIRSRISASGASDILILETLGWIDTRGRDA